MLKAGRNVWILAIAEAGGGRVLELQSARPFFMS
jgi:hypothetical protein